MKPHFRLNSNSNINVIITCTVFWGLFLLLLLLSGPVTPMFPKSWQRFIFGASGTMLAFFLTWLFLKYEKRSYKEIDLVWQSGTSGRFLLGLLIGSGIFGVILLSLILLTPLQIQRNTTPVDSSALLGYLAFFPLSLMEEIAFRSYPFIKLHQRFGLRMTQVIVAVAFALYHVAGGQSVFSSFLGSGVYAFVFGLAAVWSGGIAMPFGIHVALNILQPLTGLRGNAGAVWTLNPREGMANGQMTSPDTIGTAMQVIILVLVVLLTEYYIRKNRSKPQQKEGQVVTEKESSPGVK